MKTITVLCVLLLSGCASMTPTQKRVAAVVGTVVIVGAVAAHGSSNDGIAVREPGGLPCHTQPDGSCR
jgi:hypothetical protein